MPFYNCGTQDFIRLISGSESPASDLNACVRVGKLRPVRIKATTYLGNLRILAQLLLSNIYLKLCQRLPYDKYNLIHQKTQLSSTRLNHNTITERWNQFKVHYLKTSHCDLSEISSKYIIWRLHTVTCQKSVQSTLFEDFTLWPVRNLLLFFDSLSGYLESFFFFFISFKFDFSYFVYPSCSHAYGIWWNYCKKGVLG